jgi:hypothetical protein
MNTILYIILILWVPGIEIPIELTVLSHEDFAHPELCEEAAAEFNEDPELISISDDRLLSMVAYCRTPT